MAGGEAVATPVAATAPAEPPRKRKRGFSTLRVAPTVPPLAPAKVLRSDASVPTRRRSSRVSRAAASTATAASGDSRGAAEVSEPQPAATTTEPLRVAAEAQQAATVAEPRQLATAVEPQQAASVTAATTAVAVAAPLTSPAPAAAGSPKAVVVEIPDDDVPPPGWDQWASPPVSAPEASAGALVARGDVGAALRRPADGAGASSSRAGPAARLEQEREHADASPAHFVEAQAEQGLWQELRDHGASLNRARNEALRIHSGPCMARLLS